MVTFLTKRSKRQLYPQSAMVRGESYVARWTVPLPDRVHIVEFEHGTISGKRVLRLDGNEIHKKDWMFRLVGTEVFFIGHTECILNIDSIKGLKFSYTLTVNGKPFETFTEIQNKVLKSWNIGGDNQLVVTLDTQSMKIYVNGEPVEMESDFTEDGSEMRFPLDGSREGVVRISNGVDSLQYLLQVEDAYLPVENEF